MEKSPSPVKRRNTSRSTPKRHWTDEEALEISGAAYCAPEQGVFVRFRDGLTGFFKFADLGMEDLIDQMIPESLTVEIHGTVLSIPTTDGDEFDIDHLVLRARVDADTKHRLKQLEVKYAKEWGDRIRALRKSERWTQVELSSRSGLDQAVISKLERGLHYPRPKTLEKIARAFSLPVIDMLTDK